MLRYIAGGVAVAACGGNSSTTQADCDAIAKEIRDAANVRGISSVGVCSTTNAAIQRDLGPACARLKACEDALAN